MDKIMDKICHIIPTFNHNRGSSMVPVVVTLAILGSVIMTASMNLVRQFKDTRSVELTRKADTLGNDLTVLLGQPQFCATALQASGAITIPASWMNANVQAETYNAITSIGLPNVILVQVNTQIRDLWTRSITLSKNSQGFGPFTARVLDPTTGAFINQQKHLLTLEIVQEKVAQGSNFSYSGGNAVRRQQINLVATVDTATRQITSCYGGQDQNFLRDVCVQVLGGTFDTTQHPNCLISKLALANDWNKRDNLLRGNPSTNAGAIPAATASAISVDGPLHISGLWTGPVTPNSHDLPLGRDSWIGPCLANACVLSNNGTDINQDYLHIGGVQNDNYRTRDGTIPGSLVTFQTHVVLPVPGARFGIGTENSAPRAALEVISNLSPLAKFIHRTGEAIMDITNNLPFTWRLAASATEFKFLYKSGGSYNQVVTMSDTGINEAVTPSDQRLKENIKKLAGVLKRVLMLEPVTFKYNHLPGRPMIGLIAQEVVKYFPEVIFKSAEGSLRIDYSQLATILVKAVQELDDEINAEMALCMATNDRIDSELNQLEAENQLLEQELAALKQRYINVLSSL